MQLLQELQIRTFSVIFFEQIHQAVVKDGLAVRGYHQQR